MKDRGHDGPVAEFRPAALGASGSRRPRLVSRLKTFRHSFHENSHHCQSHCWRQETCATTHTTHVIEVGDVTAGIVVATEGGLRFFAASLTFKSLDLAIFPSIAEASGPHANKFVSVVTQHEASMITKALLVTVTAIVTALFLSAFRKRANLRTFSLMKQ
ncbi:hypothetical protein [Microvirga sp. KLBC 81]|uniref:hypothetical protein n=1 Tax=Microvirga sp. KLBC 81 TaxID=1862707 RepID=UPI0010580CAC|nr:hypothetical protein [Microvirga sp. KLBC 81]